MPEPAGLLLLPLRRGLRVQLPGEVLPRCPPRHHTGHAHTRVRRALLSREHSVLEHSCGFCVPAHVRPGTCLLCTWASSPETQGDRPGGAPVLLGNGLLSCPRCSLAQPSPGAPRAMPPPTAFLPGASGCPLHQGGDGVVLALPAHQAVPVPHADGLRPASPGRSRPAGREPRAWSSRVSGWGLTSVAV